MYDGRMHSSLRFYTDPDDARDLRYEDEHDARYGPDAEPDPARVEALVDGLAERYAEIVGSR